MAETHELKVAGCPYFDRLLDGTKTFEVRRLCGLPTGRGPQFTAPELEALRDQVTRMFDTIARSRADHFLDGGTR